MSVINGIALDPDNCFVFGKQMNTTHPTEDFSTLNTPEAARYFLMNLAHPNIILVTVVGECDLGIFHKA